MRIDKHPILGDRVKEKEITITINGKDYLAYLGETIAAVMLSNGLRKTGLTKANNSKGVFCGIGQCSDCIMQVNGRPNVRSCITYVEEGMVVNSQNGYGEWGRHDD